jgi:hypothetical protein
MMPVACSGSRGSFPTVRETIDPLSEPLAPPAHLREVIRVEGGVGG